MSDQARDDGMNRVQENNPEFKKQYAEAIDALPVGWIGTNETIRLNWSGVYAPPQAWGANWGAHVRRGRLVMLDQRIKMVGSLSNSRKTNLYQKVA